MVIGRANGKIILMGEHAVVYGEPAIAMPFSAVSVTARVVAEGQALQVSCDFYKGLVHQMPKVLESLKHAIRLSLYRIGAPTDPAIHITVDSTIPAERGMGSSAAVAVAITRSLYAYYQKELSEQDLWEIVQSAEKIAHGNPSGVDAATTSGSQPVFFIKGQEMAALNIQLDAYLLVADTGKTGQTLEAVADVARLIEKNQEAATWIAELGRLTRQAKECLQQEQARELGQLMTEAHSYLQGLGVSDETLDRLVERACSEGALGAKLTGGGRGGCMIALAETKDQAENIARALEEAGATQTWIQYLGE